jgi:exonuclease SbcC
MSRLRIWFPFSIRWPRRFFLRPIKLSLENFGPYRELAMVDFGTLGEFFLISGKTGSGKSTLFDAISYALYGQAPGARRGSESELVSDFAAPGDRPAVEFEFSLSEVPYMVRRVAPYARPKRGGGLVSIPPTATLYSKHSIGSAGLANPMDLIGAENAVAPGWKVLADGVRDVNEAVSGLIGLSADEFSKIILLPQGDFQRFLEMESTERSLVLEKLFPVDMHEKIADLAKSRAQRVKTELSLMSENIGRLSLEAGEDSAGRLDALKEDLAASLKEEELALGGLSASERLFEEETRRAGRANLALEAIKALELLQARQDQESERDAKIQAARRSQSLKPSIAAYQKARKFLAQVDDRVKRTESELEQLRSEEAAIESKKAGIKICIDGIDKGRMEVFSLEKALEAWKRREEALYQVKNAEVHLKDAQAKHGELGRAIDARRQQMGALKLSFEGEPELRSDLDWLLDAATGIALMLAKAKSKALLAAELSSLEKSALDYSRKFDRALADRDEAAQCLDRAESFRMASEAARLALGLSPGQPCPVCGSKEHPAPTVPASGLAFDDSFLQKIQIELGSAKTNLLRAEAAIEGLASSMRHVQERKKTCFSSIEAALADLREDNKSFNVELSMESPSLFEDIGQIHKDYEDRISAIRLDLKHFDEGRKALALEEQAFAKESLALEVLRAELEKARQDLAGRMTLLAEAERQSGSLDPEPRYRQALSAVETLEKEKRSLEADCVVWEQKLTSAKAMRISLEQQRVEAEESLNAELLGLSVSLVALGYVESSQDIDSAISVVESQYLDPSTLEREEGILRSYREDLAAARAKADSLAAFLPAPGSALPDLSRLESLVADARSRVAKARVVSDEKRIAIAKLEEIAGQIASLESRRRELEVSSRNLYTMSELLKGELSGRRLPFKHFVLAMYFAEVVRRASIHLSSMSDGRYYLEPEDGQVSGRGKTGLGLRVLDSWTGQSRPTSTLSGGEKFLTSISLAFGLADSIRDRNGSVSLDALFIDEGFGSLDEEALDRAITVLDRIRGRRIIGIVSHVAGLESRIPCRIEVEKLPGGSKISVFAPALS